MIYKRIIGTGGIGNGMLFLSKEMETLGRSESRLVTLSPAKDYCKLHIVLHYPAALSKQRFEVIPIGYVGEDFSGESLLLDMQRIGMKVDYVGSSSDLPTMISICLQYPDKDGCNITSINNAVQSVTPEYIVKCLEQLKIDSDCIVAAIPEVSVEARTAILRFAKARGAYCVLSVPSSEADIFLNTDAFTNCDLLAVNEAEARALVKSSAKGELLAESLYEKLNKINNSINVLVTFGRYGSCTVTKRGSEWIPTIPVPVINTTGAGDACLGGTVAGLALGYPLQKGVSDDIFGRSCLESAVELGTICATMAVMCQDSIAWDVDVNSINKMIKQEGWESKYAL